MSEMRGTIGDSPASSARRSALLTAFSRAEMGRRCETPLLRSIFLSRRAAKATASTTSRTQRGTTRFAPRSVQASCAVIATPCSSVVG